MYRLLGLLILAMPLSAEVSISIRPQPAIGQVKISVKATEPWRLQWSPNLTNWWTIYEQLLVTTTPFNGVHGTARDVGFYRVQAIKAP